MSLEARRSAVDGLEPARYLRNDVHHVGVALDLHQTRNAHRSRGADSTNVIAGQVYEHDVLGPLPYKVIALARLVCPRANIPATTALATLNRREGRELGLVRGANVVMPNLTPPKYRALYEIYPDKACIAETGEACHHCLSATDRGDRPAARPRAGRFAELRVLAGWKAADADSRPARENGEIRSARTASLQRATGAD